MTMSKIRVNDADNIKEANDSYICATCTKYIEQDKWVKDIKYNIYCNPCASYWQDVDNGLYNYEE